MSCLPNQLIKFESKEVVISKEVNKEDAPNVTKNPGVDETELDQETKKVEMIKDDSKELRPTDGIDSKSPVETINSSPVSTVSLGKMEETETEVKVKEVRTQESAGKEVDEEDSKHQLVEELKVGGMQAEVKPLVDKKVETIDTVDDEGELKYLKKDEHHKAISDKKEKEVVKLQDKKSFEKTATCNESQPKQMEAKAGLKPSSTST